MESLIKLNAAFLHQVYSIMRSVLYEPNCSWTNLRDDIPVREAFQIRRGKNKLLLVWRIFNIGTSWFFVIKTHFTFLFAYLQTACNLDKNTTKAESAWLFRVWYVFDHRYPFLFQAAGDSFITTGTFIIPQTGLTFRNKN